VPAFLLSDHRGWELAVEVRALRPRELSRPAIPPLSRVVALATLIVVRIAAEAVTPTGISRTLS
jgi:hypothetical protein